MQLEKLTGKDLFTLQVAHMQSDISGRMTFIHKMNLYVHSVLERQIRLYEWLLGNLKDLLNAIGILSTGHLPPYLFPPTVLEILPQCSGYGHENTSQFCFGYQTPY